MKLFKNKKFYQIGFAVLLLAILIWIVFMYNKVGKEGFRGKKHMSDIIKEHCSEIEDRNEMKDCINERIPHYNDMDIINDIITKSGILAETCPNAKNNNDKNKCIKKYLEKNKNTILYMNKPEILGLVCIDAKKDTVKNYCVEKYLKNNPQVQLKI
jgi:hypothetical protein